MVLNAFIELTLRITLHFVYDIWWIRSKRGKELPKMPSFKLHD